MICLFFANYTINITPHKLILKYQFVYLYFLTDLFLPSFCRKEVLVEVLPRLWNNLITIFKISQSCQCLPYIILKHATLLYQPFYKK